MGQSNPMVAFTMSGLAVLAPQSAVFLSTVKWFGGGYLIWLDIESLRAGVEHQLWALGRWQMSQGRRTFHQGLLVNWLAPKLALAQR